MNTTLIPDTFTGEGEVKGFTFTRVSSTQELDIFEVLADGSTRPHYEVIVKKFSPVCVDFENRIYSETEFKQVYPKAKDFGVFGWSFRDLQTANDFAQSYKQ